MESGDLEGEEEAPMKWRDYEIETLIVIRGGMEEKFEVKCPQTTIAHLCTLKAIYVNH